MSALRSSFSVFSRAARTISVSRSLVPVARPVAVYFRANLQPIRGYAVSSGLSKEAIETRVLDVIKTFDKVTPEKLSTTARFAEDLGLDSLDAVEIVMAVEEEFGIEIPDDEADAILTVQQAIEYIQKTPAAH